MADTTLSSALPAPGPADEPETAAACRRPATLDPDARYVTIVSTYSIAFELAEPLMQLLSSAAEKILRQRLDRLGLPRNSKSCFLHH